MTQYIQSGVFGNYFVTLCFLISTLYGLNYYYQGLDYGTNIVFEEKPDSFWDAIFTDGTDWFFSVLSVLNPMILIKAFFFDTMANENYGTYQALDIFLLRPIGWVATYMFAEFLINKLRGISG